LPFQQRVDLAHFNGLFSQGLIPSGEQQQNRAGQQRAFFEEVLGEAQCIASPLDVIEPEKDRSLLGKPMNEPLNDDITLAGFLKLNSTRTIWGFFPYSTGHHLREGMALIDFFDPLLSELSLDSLQSFLAT